MGEVPFPCVLTMGGGRDQKLRRCHVYYPEVGGLRIGRLARPPRRPIGGSGRYYVNPRGNRGRYRMSGQRPASKNKSGGRHPNNVESSMGTCGLYSNPGGWVGSFGFYLHCIDALAWSCRAVGHGPMVCRPDLSFFSEYRAVQIRISI